jgi:hypothetical protein
LFWGIPEKSEDCVPGALRVLEFLKIPASLKIVGEPAKYKERISRIWDSGHQWHAEIHKIAEIS